MSQHQTTVRRSASDLLPREVTGLTDSHQHVLALLRETVHGQGGRRSADQANQRRCGPT